MTLRGKKWDYTAAIAEAAAQRGAEPRPYDSMAIILAAMRQGLGPADIERALIRPPAPMLRVYGLGDLRRSRAALPEAAARLVCSVAGIPLADARPGPLLDGVLRAFPGLGGREREAADALGVRLVGLVDLLFTDPVRVRAFLESNTAPEAESPGASL